MILEFNDWSDDLNVAKMTSDIHKTNFIKHGVTLADFQETITNASKVLKPYIGRLTRIDRIKNIIFAVMFFLMLFIVILAGLYENFALAVTVAILYCIFVFVV